MSRGQPDFGMYAAVEVIGSIADMGELAARLGSPDTFERQGNVIFIGDFEHGLEGWLTATSGTGASVTWSPDYKLRGGFSAKLVAGSDSERYAEIKRELAYPSLVNIGFEAAWTEDADMEKIDGYITLYTGAFKIDWAFRYDAVTGQNYVLTTGDTWQAIGDPVESYKSDYLFYITKVVVDPVNLVYKKMIAGPTSFDIDGIAATYAVNTGLARMEASGRVYSLSGKNATVYVDSIIITQNEP